MKPIKLQKGKNSIILFAVTDIMGGEEAICNYHIIDEQKKVASLLIEQIKEYTFVKFVEDTEDPII